MRLVLLMALTVAAPAICSPVSPVYDTTSTTSTAARHDTTSLLMRRAPPVGAAATGVAGAAAGAARGAGAAGAGAAGAAKAADPWFKFDTLLTTGSKFFSIFSPAVKKEARSNAQVIVNAGRAARPPNEVDNTVKGIVAGASVVGGGVALGTGGAILGSHLSSPKPSGNVAASSGSVAGPATST